MKVETQYDPGDMVVLRHDPDKMKRMVTAISVRDKTNLSYCLACGDSETWHVECEMERVNSENTKNKAAGFKRDAQ